MMTNDLRTTSGSRSAEVDVRATRAANATAGIMVTVSFVLVSIEDEMNSDGGDDREHERQPQRRSLHRSASVPARHDGEPQRLNAPSLSALAAQRSTASVAVPTT